MSLHAYQLTKAQENWFANNIDGYYQHAPNNLLKIFYLFSDNPLPELKEPLIKGHKERGIQSK